MESAATAVIYTEILFGKLFESLICVYPCSSVVPTAFREVKHG